MYRYDSLLKYITLFTAQGERFYKACLGLATDNGQDGDIITVKIALGSMQTNAKVGKTVIYVFAC